MENAFGQPQNVVIFGGSSDIARAITKKLCAARAHTVILAGRNQGLLDAAALEAQEYGATKTNTVLFDANDPSNAERTVSEAFAKVGDQIDLVIIAVGLLGNQTSDQESAAASAEMITVNVTWPVAALAEIRNRLIAQGSGRILVMSSVAAIRVRESTYLYSGAKAGLDRICSGLAQSLEGTGVKLQLLRPAVVRTKMTVGADEPPFTTGANEVAENVMRGLASNDDVIWSPPLLRYVFFVLRHLPAPLWRKVTNR
ncbi:MAG TPA: SDR family NAD(P)-dependent oxidoreductase [Acidimicrobiales bacterium]|nr:SDR family NAD(P)-dependent oxidoreductase [Acidimicrobiales bacterium]